MFLEGTLGLWVSLSPSYIMWWSHCFAMICCPTMGLKCAIWLWTKAPKMRIIGYLRNLLVVMERWPIQRFCSVDVVWVHHPSSLPFLPSPALWSHELAKKINHIMYYLVFKTTYLTETTEGFIFFSSWSGFIYSSLALGRTLWQRGTVYFMMKRKQRKR